MPKHKDPVLRQLVLESMLRQIDNPAEAIRWINEHYCRDPATGKIRPGIRELKPRRYYMIKASIKDDTDARILLLKKEEYVQETFRSIRNTKDHIAKLWALHDKVGVEVKKPALQAAMQQRLIMDINVLEVRLSQFFDALPFVSAVQARLKTDLDKITAGQQKVESAILDSNGGRSEEDLLKEIVDGPKEDPAT